MKDFDYSSPGAYFVTLVTKNREPIFGRLDGENVILNSLGEMAQQEWLESAAMRKEIRLDESILMPNHLHSIIFIDDLDPSQHGIHSQTAWAHGRAPLRRRPRSLGSLIAAYKAATTRRIREIIGDEGLKLWQRNYYDHVIRDQIDLENIREYIAYNPLKLSHGGFWK